MQLAGLPDISNNQVMRDAWYRRELIKQAASGALDKVAHVVCEKAQTDKRFLIEIYHFKNLPAHDTQRSGPTDTVEFSVSFRSPQWRLLQPSVGILSKLNDADGVSDLAQRISNMKDLDFHWVDLTIGVRLRYGEGYQKGWGAADIWERALQPWLSLIR